jgi:peptide/nickel transport system substrate-binding protein
MKLRYSDRRGRRLLSRRRALRIAMGGTLVSMAAVAGCREEKTTTTREAAPSAPGARAPAAEVNLAPVPQYSKKFREVTRLLEEYHWSKHPDRKNPLRPRTGGVFTLFLNLPAEFDWVTTGVGQTPARAGLTNSNVLTMDSGAFARNPDLIEVSTKDSLAESFEQPDVLSYVFKFRTGVRWHNLPPVNGRAFNVEDVKYAWEVMAKPPSVHTAIFGAVDGIQAVDAGTLKVTLKTPFAPFPKMISSPNTSIFAREHFEGPDGLHKTAIGTGPFILKSSDPGRDEVLVRNPEYFIKDEFGTPLPYLDAVRDVKNLADVQSSKAAFASKQIDYIGHGQLPAVNDFLEVRRQVPDSVGQVWPQAPTLLHMFNFQFKEPMFRDVRVRRAFSMAIDRTNTFVDTVFQGGATPAAFIAYNYLGEPWPLPVEKLGSYYQFNPQETRRLLEAAGISLPLKVEVLSGTSGTFSTFVQGLAPDMKEAGIEVEQKTLETVAHANAYFTGNWSQLHTWNLLTGKNTDADGFAYERYYSKSPYNAGGYSNPEVDRLAEAQRREPDPQKRLQLIKQLFDILLADVPIVIAGENFQNLLWHSYLHDFSDNLMQWGASWMSTQIARVWLDERAPRRNVS